MCGGVLYIYISCKAVKRLSELKKCCWDCLMLSSQSFCWLCLLSVVQSFTCSFSGNVPLLHTSTRCPGMSLHVISFTRPSSMLVLQATNPGVGRPGYKAIQSSNSTVANTSMVPSSVLFCSTIQAAEASDSQIFPFQLTSNRSTVELYISWNCTKLQESWKELLSSCCHHAELS